MSSVNKTLEEVTKRIIERSAASRQRYLARIEAARVHGPVRRTLGCTNQAHSFAAAPESDKAALKAGSRPNIGIVSAYNDMLSAHQPYESYPTLLKSAARSVGAIAQVAGGVPAMCDGVTQGHTGMELSLFSRDVIAMGTAVALSHNTFDAALCLGICDKIVPGLLIGALSFGHLPVIFVPAGPMTSGLGHAEKAQTRQLYVQGKVSDEALLESESKCFHSAGTCTFFGTANSNQMLMEIMGLHLPGSAFVNPNTPLRDALTAEAARQVTRLTAMTETYTPIGHVVSEKTIANAIVGLLATGSSTNHTIHLVAIARAAGIVVTWDDFNDLSAVVPTISHVYPAGKADVNDFQAAGGVAVVIRELAAAGLLHTDVKTVANGGGIEPYELEPYLDGKTLRWRDAPHTSRNTEVLGSVEAPFAPDGGLKLLQGNLGRAICKTSALKKSHRVVEAKAIVFDDQLEVQDAFQRGELNRDCIVVVRYQGPRARGMPELHKLTPLLTLLQEQGFKVGLVTDGRMSGASGKVPSAIHVTPECASGGPLTRVKTGDVIFLDSEHGILEVKVPELEFSKRPFLHPSFEDLRYGSGRELFVNFRRNALGAEQGPRRSDLKATISGKFALDFFCNSLGKQHGSAYTFLGS